jgi:hypothetical protein
LVPGTFYVFRVSCINKFGEGPAAQPNAATPVRRNARVLALLATLGLNTHCCAGTDGDRNGDGEEPLKLVASSRRRAVRFVDET